jgi:hypothetical protein
MTYVCMYVGKLQVWIPLQRYPKRWAISRNFSELLRCVQVISATKSLTAVNAE